MKESELKYGDVYLDDEGDVCMWLGEHDHSAMNKLWLYELRNGKSHLKKDFVRMLSNARGNPNKVIFNLFDLLEALHIKHGII